MTIFEKIITREIPAHIIYEDDRVISFLTIQPFAEGHVLVVPKVTVDQLWDMEDDDYQYLLSVAKMISLHLRKVMAVARVGMIVKGFDVPHTHIHLVPIPGRGTTNLDVDNPPIADDAELARIAEKISIL